MFESFLINFAKKICLSFNVNSIFGYFWPKLWFNSMTKKGDIILVRYLLVWALIVSALVMFWLIFDTIKSYQQISDEIENYLKQSLLVFNGTDSSFEFFSDEFLEQMLDKSMKSVLFRSFENYLITVFSGNNSQTNLKAFESILIEF